MYEWVSPPKYYDNYSNYNKQTATATLKTLPPRPPVQQQSNSNNGKNMKHYTNPTASSSGKQSLLRSSNNGAYGNINSTKFVTNDVYPKQLTRDPNTGIYSFANDNMSANSLNNSKGLTNYHKASANTHLNSNRSNAHSINNKSEFYGYDNAFENELQAVIYEDDLIGGGGGGGTLSFRKSNGQMEPDGPVVVETYQADEYGKQFVPVEQKYYNSSKEAKNAINNGSHNSNNVFYYSTNGDDYGKLIVLVGLLY
jgi:hypothetical protein